MKNKLIKSMLLLTFIFLAVIGMKSAVYAEGDEAGDQLFDYSFDINFLNEDETPWNTNQYDAIPKVAVPKGTEYTYTWGNGQTGSGVVGNERAINIRPDTTEANNTVRVTLKLTENDANGNIWFYRGSKVYFSKTILDGSDISRWSSEQLRLDKDNVKEAKLYKATQEPQKINVRFLHEDGTAWTVKNNFVYSGSVAYVVSNNYDIKYDFNNGKTYENQGNNGGSLSPNRAENLYNTSTATVYLGGLGETDSLEVRGPNAKYYSKVVVNGTEVKNDERTTINFAEAGEVNLDFYIPETVTGNVSIQSYDGSLSEDFVWNFHFSLSANETNFDPDTLYWTLDGDETKHMAIPTKTPYNCAYALDVQVPFGRKATLHNIPVTGQIMTSGNETWVYNEVSSTNKANRIRVFKDNYNEFEGDDRFSYIYEFGGRTVITYRGEDITDSIINNLGINDRYTFYNKYNSGNEDQMVIDTSGNINNFHWNDGFEINYYVFRKNAQIMFGKEYDENDKTVEEGKLFHFRVKLTDPATQNVLSGRVAYYTYTSDDEIIEDNNNVKYAELDENGYIDVYLKAGEYARLGKILTDEEIAAKKLYASGNSNKTLNKATDKDIYKYYFNDLGMLPYGVEYSVEEIDDDYDYNVIEENKENGIGTHWSSSPTTQFTATECYNRLNGFKFINTRKTGTLIIESIVEGETTDREFKFNVKMLDSAKNFPLEYDYEKSDGTRGRIKFTEGRKVTKEDREYTEYTATVYLKNKEKITIIGLPSGAQYELSESEESSKGYDVENTEENGKIKPDDSEEKSMVKYVHREKQEEEIIEEETEEKEKTVVEDPEEAKQVQTGDIIGKVLVTIAIAGTILGITLVKRRKK